MTTPPDTPKPPAELWVVIDDVGQPEYSASYPEAAQEYINDWIENASDSTVKILGLGKYSSHRYILAPSPQESPCVSQDLIDDLNALLDRVDDNKKAALTLYERECIEAALTMLCKLPRMRR